MEALLASLVSKYGFEIAAEMLGLNKQTQNPKYTFGMPFTNQQISFDPVQTLGRFGLNKAFSGGMGIMGPAAIMGGAFILGNRYNPLNPKAVNYNPNLQNEINYAAKKGYITKDPGTGLNKYGPNSVLSGQNVVSMFGTNSYIGQLNKKIDYFEDRIKKGKKINEDNYEKAKKEKKDYFDERADIRDKAKTKVGGFKSPNIHGNNKDSSSGGHAGGQSAADASAAQSADDAAAGAGGYRRGGIANLYG